MSLRLNRTAKFPPREPRNATDMPASVLLGDGREVAVTIKNFTPHGFMAVARGRIEEACEFGVSIPGYGIVRASVRWIDGREFGASFDCELPTKALSEF